MPILNKERHSHQTHIHRCSLRKVTLEELDKIVADSSEKNRNFFIAYLVLLIYVQFIIFSTTDLQLLTGNGIRLPFGYLTMPLDGFYVAAPIFIFTLHVNFLQNLEIHHHKLMRWLEKHPQKKAPRELIQPFLFDHAELNDKGMFQSVVRYANTLLCLNLAPITLGLLLWRYSDSQSIPFVIWHFVWFSIDSYWVWRFREALEKNKGIYTPENLEQLAIKHPSLQSLGENKKVHFSNKLKQIIAKMCFFTEIGRYFKTTMLQHCLTTLLGVVLFATVVSTVIIVTTSSVNVLLIAKWLEDKSEFKFSSPVVNWGYSKFISGTSSLLIPRISVDFHEQTNVMTLESREKSVKMTDSFHLAIKNLRFAQLSGMQMSNAWLEGASLEGANLEHANLENADLTNANLMNAKLSGTNLKNVTLNDTHLEQADLKKVHLEHTVMANGSEGIQLNNYDLTEAHLEDADLTKADLGGANLTGAYLQNAMMENANLTGATLTNANLTGAFLRYAIFENATLEFAHLEKTKLANANFENATIIKASLINTELTRANLTNSSLNSSILIGAKLNPATLEAAQLEEVDLRGADLSGANLKSANLKNAHLEGSNLTNTQFQNANLEGAQFQGALFKNTDLTGAIMPATSEVFFLENSAFKDVNWGKTQEVFKHEPAAIQKVLSLLCQKDEKNQEEEIEEHELLLATIVSIRKNYQFLPEKNHVDKIDETLCFHPACTKLLPQLKDLDCKRLNNNQNDPHH